MENNKLFNLYLIIGISLLLPNWASSQLIHPYAWSDLVNDPVRNGLCRDTFLFQSFENMKPDNWSYKDLGNTKSFLFNINVESWPGQGGGHSLCLLGESEVLFELSNTGEFKNVRASFIIGASPSENSKFELFSRYKDKPDKLDYILCKDNEKIFYRRKFLLNGKTEADHISVDNDPVSLRMKVTKGKSNGYFYIDSLLAYGDRYDYSLFTGSGFWDSGSNWSHAPVYSKRSALIAGNVVYQGNSMPVSIKKIAVNDGSIQLLDNTFMDMDSLYLWGDNAFVYVKGELEVNKKLSVIKTFPEKGAWYFFSLPFDLYASDVDQRFKLGDEKTTNTGNYIYFLSYDGEKRSVNKQSRNNWQVIPANYPVDRPLLKKGKGYLIALDEEAETTELIFSSRSGEKVVFDSHDYLSELNPGVMAGDKAGDHYGWMLCGNPFPSPISISQINEHANRDPSIYVFNGNEYKAYKSGDQVSIPPYSAFFVKVSQPMQLRIKNTGEPVNYPAVKANSPLRMEINDPQVAFQTNSMESNPDNPVIKGFREKTVIIDNPDEKADLSVISIAGRVIFRTNLSKGISHIHIPVSQGIYVLHVKGTSYQAQDKFVIN